MNVDLSIIVPVYNTRNYLAECVESIACQGNSSFRFEVILVDDGSTDGSGDLCDFFSNKYSFVRAVHKENSGPSDARNMGLLNAEGIYVLFVDSDDYIAKGSLSRIVSCYRRQGNPDVVFLSAKKTYPNGSACSLEEGIPAKNVLNKTNLEVLQYISKRKKYPGSACTKLVKRALLINKDICFETGNKLEDLDWTMQVLLNGDSFGCCNADYYYYRQGRQGSRTNCFSQKSYSDLKGIIDSWIALADSVGDCKVKHDAILSFAAYEYRIALLSSGSYWDKENRDWLKKHRYLLGYRKREEDCLIKTALAVFGIRGTAAVLKCYLKIRDSKIMRGSKGLLKKLSQ